MSAFNKEDKKRVWDHIGSKGQCCVLYKMCVIYGDVSHTKT